MWPHRSLIVSSLREKVLLQPKRTNVFFIVFGCHERMSRRISSQARCCLWSLENYEIIPSRARNSASGVPFEVREIEGDSILKCGAGRRGINSARDVFILKWSWRGLVKCLPDSMKP